MKSLKTNFRNFLSSLKKRRRDTNVKKIYKIQTKYFNGRLIKFIKRQCYMNGGKSQRYEKIVRVEGFESLD